MANAGIKKQVLYLVLSCCLVTLLFAVGISIYGILNIKSNAVKIGMEIGTAAAENSTESLKEVSLTSLQGLMHERAKQINAFFSRLVWDVTLMSNEMTRIMQNPQNYPPRHVLEPDGRNAGKNVPQLQYRLGADRNALAYEVGLAAHLQDFQVGFYDTDSTIGSNYVASVNGFNITVDPSSDLRVDQYNNPMPNDYSSRPWYVNAMRENKLTFTDAFVDAHGRGLAMGCSAPYYGANGEIAGVVGEGKFLTDVSNIVKDTKMGTSGFAFVLNNKTGQVLFTPRIEGTISVDNDNDLSNDPSLFDSDNGELADTARKMSQGETGISLVNIDGKNYYLAFTSLENKNWSFGVAIEEDEVIAPAKVSREKIAESTNDFITGLNHSIQLMIAAIVVAFLAIVGLVPFAGKRVANKLTKPILELSDGVREIASGNLDKKLDIHTGNEIEHLAVCFNAMTDELQTYMNHLTKVTAEKERIATELSVATNIQESMLPNIFPAFPECGDFDVYATMHAAKEVGGDFYDFYMPDDEHLMITIADVSGKGVPAALFMVISKTILKNFAMNGVNADNLPQLIANANDQLCQNNDAMMFVTAFVGLLDLKTGRFTYVNAGHNPPLIYKANSQEFSYINVKHNFVMGGMDGLTFKKQEITFSPGDRLFLYTDGVTEALNEAKELYGEERLLEALNHTEANPTLEELLAAVRKSLDAHVGQAEQSDDITMLALAYNGETTKA